MISPYPKKNSPTAKCEKSTICRVLDVKIHELQSDCSNNQPTAQKTHQQRYCSWWIFRKRLSHLAGYRKKHFALSGFPEQALRNW